MSSSRSLLCPCCMPELSATHAEPCAIGAHSTTSVLPTQLDLGCTEGGLHNRPHTRSRGCTRVTCTHPHLQHWDTPTLPLGSSHPQLPAGSRCTPAPLGGSPPLWGGGEIALCRAGAQRHDHRDGGGVGIGVGGEEWSRLCCAKPGPRWKPPRPGCCPSPGERRGAAPANVAAAARTSAGLSRRDPPACSRTNERTPGRRAPGCCRQEPSHTHTEGHRDPGAVPAPPELRLCRGSRGGAVATVTELPERRDEWAGSARDL